MIFKKDRSKERCIDAISDAFKYLKDIELFYKYTNCEVKSVEKQARFEIEQSKQGLKMALMQIEILIEDSK